MTVYETREDRQSTYDKYATILDNLIQRSDRHAAETPDCGAEPVCIDGEVMENLHLLCSVSDDYALLTICVAVRELSRARKREAGLSQRLEIQRAMSADASVARQVSELRCEQLEGEIQSLLARLDEVEHERVIEP